MRFAKSLAAACVLSTIGWSAGPAAAASALQVTPSSGLTNGTVVNVTGTGFPANSSIAVVECRSGAVSEVDCDLGRIVFAGSDTSGTINTTFTTSTALNTGRGPVSCSTADGACAIAAASPSDIAGTAASVSISFVATPPPRRGTVTLDTTGHYPYDTVEVSGSGWAPGAGVGIWQCRADATTTRDCVQYSSVVVDNTGAFSGYGYATPEIFTTGLESVDCTAAPGCAIGVADTRAADTTLVLAAYSFVDPTDGTLSATPTRRLHGGDTIRVTGTGWRPIDVVSLFECVTGTDVCNSLDPWPQPDAHGDVADRVQVQQWLDGDHVCGWATTQCELRWGNARIPDPTHSIALQFVAPPAVTTGTVTAPAVAHVGDAVTATLDGWVANGFVHVAQCAIVGTVATAECRDFVEVPTDGTGSGSVDLWYVATQFSTDHGTYDCDTAGRCAIVAWDPRDPAGSAASSPITVSPIVAGTLDASPSTDLHDGDRVHLTGSGWSPGETVVMNLCARDAGLGAVCRFLGYDTTSSTGALDTTTTVTALIHSGFWPLDCSDAMTPCIVRVTLSHDTRQSATTDIDFAPTGTPITSHYSPTDAATVHGAATDLGLDDAAYQRTAAWATMFVLGIAHATTLGTVAADTGATGAGATALTSTYPQFEADHLEAVATRFGVTPETFQHHAALAVAFILGVS